MSIGFFAAPDFLMLLRFWVERCKSRVLPAWNGDLAQIPAALLPNIIISERCPEPVYRYVGADCARRWGGDPTGRRMYGEVLTGAHARYIRSLEEDVLARGAPIFSTAFYGRGAGDVLTTGRLFVPFTAEGEAAPRFIMALQLFEGSDTKLSALGESGFAQEIDRKLIASVPELCARLDRARRYAMAARGVHDRSLARELAAAADELSGRVLISLPCLTSEAEG